MPISVKYSAVFVIFQIQAGLSARMFLAAGAAEL